MARNNELGKMVVAIVTFGIFLLGLKAGFDWISILLVTVGILALYGMI